VRAKNTAADYDTGWVTPFTQAAADARYLTPATAASTYLPLAGGTLTGGLLFSADNSLDIGTAAASRPRTAYVGTSLVTPSIDSSGVALNVGPTTNNVIQFRTNNVNRWQITNTALITNADAATDIGTAAGNRPRNLYLASFLSEVEIAAPATPAAGSVRVYPKSDHHLYTLDSTGVETDLTLGGITQTQGDARYLQLTGGTLTGAVNLTTFLQLAEMATPATPAAGQVRLYAKSDHKVYTLDATGLETQLPNYWA
jgi:hypothetical protein